MSEETLLNKLRQEVSDLLTSWGVGHLTHPLLNKITPLITKQTSTTESNLTKKALRMELELNSKQNEIKRVRNELHEIKKIVSVEKLELARKYEETAAKLKETQLKLKKLEALLRTHEEEVNRLYNLTETEPKYRIYYIIRDAAPNWVPFEEIYRYSTLKPTLVRQYLEEFEERNLISLKNKQAKAVHVIRRTE